jgi:hypothetical protein
LAFPTKLKCPQSLRPKCLGYLAIFYPEPSVFKAFISQQRLAMGLL